MATWRYRVIFPQDTNWQSTLARRAARELRRYGHVAHARGGDVLSEIPPEQMACYYLIGAVCRMDTIAQEVRPCCTMTGGPTSRR
jgi:hypothetical protein